MSCSPGGLDGSKMLMVRTKRQTGQDTASTVCDDLSTKSGVPEGASHPQNLLDLLLQTKLVIPFFSFFGGFLNCQETEVVQSCLPKEFESVSNSHLSEDGRNLLEDISKNSQKKTTFQHV